MYDWCNIPADDERPADGQRVVIWFEGEPQLAVYGRRSDRFYIDGRHLAVVAENWTPLPLSPYPSQGEPRDYRVCLEVDARCESHVCRATSPAAAQQRVLQALQAKRPRAKVGPVHSITATN